MKKFFSFILNSLITILTVGIMLALCFIIYIYVLSYQNNASLGDTYAYVKSVSTDTLGFTYTDKNLVNMLLTPNTSSDVQLKPKSSNYKYYYDQLDENGKLIYNVLENNIENLKEDNYKLDFSTTFNELLNKSSGKYELNLSFQSALDAFFYDHPEIFYIDLTKISLVINYTSFAGKTTYKVSLEPRDNSSNYLIDGFNSKEDVNYAIEKVENVRNNMLNLLSTNSTDYNKALAVHDTLVKLMEYDTEISNPNTRNIYGALVDTSVVCEGYAKSYKYILDSIGIDCILVSGKATNSSGESEDHMWNYIKLNDNWYGVDVTWDDPIIIGRSLKGNIIRHDYFCKKASSFNEGREPNGRLSDAGMLFTLPNLSYTDYIG